ncbi:enolase C-terminal domain-like protein [Paenibacillus koleovorans]|uniref:enolase C-terminal domain-like protein n=1 Tax=Paenibacillus koleovorans TaxID=121608 RepID=UPI000FD84821|nr:enolase C-terminal domain-like protein [Paenibacillus koleovorans]
MSIRIEKAELALEREPLQSPFGFKGGYLSELWQTLAMLRSSNGREAVGLGVQSVLWSDPNVFFAVPEQAANGMMLDMTRHALRLAVGRAFSAPPELLEQVVHETLEHGRALTGLATLRETFALNALVPVDHAAWLLYAQEEQLANYDEMIPAEYRAALNYRNRELASVPVVSYGHSDADVTRMLDEGYFLLKFKLGADPDKDGSLDKMLEWDKQRLTDVHRLAVERETKYTDCGRVLYYLDLNGRYDTKERVLRLLDHADRIGMLERVVLVEEPFPEENKTVVDDLPVRMTADESVHNLADAIERIELGYRAITLKPIAKTLSVALQVAKAAHDRSVPCFCADLTVNPWMVDWNKNLAARLAPLPGLKVGLMETNGHQNYANWETMRGYHPEGFASWTRPENGVFRLDEAFYARSAGSFARSAHYESVVQTNPILNQRGGTHI